MSSEPARTRPNTDSKSALGGDCPECNSGAVRSDDVRGEVVCEDCGCVLRSRMIDTSPEWSAFTHEENEQRSRVGSPMTELLHDRGLTTKIHWKDTDAQGNPLSPRQREKMKRLRTWQKRVRINDAGERNLQLALSEINRMTSALDIPEQVGEEGSRLYRRALEANLVQGRSIEGVACAALYVACRNQRLPRSLDEFDAIARVERREIARTYRCLAAKLDLEMAPIDPKQFLGRFCSELGVGPEIRREAARVLDDAREAGLHSGKAPAGLAGAAIYIAGLLCENKQTQSAIAEVAQVTKVTIRSRYQEQLAVVEGLS